METIKSKFISNVMIDMDKIDVCISLYMIDGPVMSMMIR